jgi:murein DD-endopeptidase MepM/ murein hydrolase activator NlpD
VRFLSILLLLLVSLLSSLSPSANATALLTPVEMGCAQSSLLAPTVDLLDQPFTGDPIAPRPAPLTPAPYTTYFTETGHYLGGAFLDYYNASPQALTLYGLPISEEFPQQFNNGVILYVQYFERARMEWHPELPEGQRVQLGALSSYILGNKTFDRHDPVDSTDTSVYFPETGHTLSKAFLAYWQTNGGLSQFGYPISEETSDNGLTVQWFERARFEYYGNMPAPYGVQLSPVGYLALKGANFNLPMGALVRFNPPRVAEGHTTTVTVGASAGVTVTGEYEGQPLLFQLDSERGVAWAVLGTQPFEDVGIHQVTINLQNGDGGKRTGTRNLETIPYPFPSESLQFDPETAALLAPDVVSQELSALGVILSRRTPRQYWSGPFSMPLDGPIRITSAFATRRCYNCPDGSAPTSYHGGMDMATDVGTPVHAPADGVVVFAGALAERGNAVIIDHGMGVFSLLAHNTSFVAKPGQVVKEGDVVSLSGNTGLSNGPHLHWEVHVSGAPVDPLEWVSRTLP